MVDQEIEPCVKDYRKYEESTAVLAALGKLPSVYGDIGQLSGITKSITTNTGPLTPDVSLSYQGGTSAVFVDLKWSLTKSTATNEILDLKKYREAQFSWRGGVQVNGTDVILIVNPEDSEYAVEATKELMRQGNTFLRDRFAIWKWFISMPSYAESPQLEGVEEMRFERVWGKTNNAPLESHVGSSKGLKIPADVLTHLRYRQRFTNDKPPVQYTIGTLLLHVFTRFRRGTHSTTSLEVKTGLIDEVYDISKSYFPDWEDPLKTPLRKRWIQEAILTMREISLSRINVPFRTRIHLEELVCRKLRAYERRQKFKKGRPPRRAVLIKQTADQTKINNF